MRILRQGVALIGQVLLIVLALWTLGACLGLVALGFCMVAGCRG